MPTFDYSHFDDYSDAMFPKHPRLICLTNWLFCFSLLSMCDLVFLAIFYPKTWLIVAIWQAVQTWK